MFIKDPYEILIEACKSECGECNDLIEDEVRQEIEDEYVEIEELEDDIEYNEDMVPVIQQEVEEGFRYLVEMDNLAKFMDSVEEEDPEEALKRIADANELEEATMCIVVESDQYIQQLISEAKTANKAGSKVKLGKLSASAKLLKNLKNKGIKVLKKKKSIKESYVHELFGRNKDKGNSQAKSTNSNPAMIEQKQRTINDLKNQLENEKKAWQERKNRTGEGGSTARIEELQKKIEVEQDRLERMKNS